MLQVKIGKPTFKLQVPTEIKNPVPTQGTGLDPAVPPRLAAVQPTRFRQLAVRPAIGSPVLTQGLRSRLMDWVVHLDGSRGNFKGFHRAGVPVDARASLTVFTPLLSSFTAFMKESLVEIIAVSRGRPGCQPIIKIDVVSAIIYF